MKKKSLLIFGLCLILALAGGFYFLWEKPQFAKVPVRYVASSDLPVIDVKIESKKFVLELDSGAQQYVRLQKHKLDQILEKKELGTWENYDIHNNRYNDPYFLVPQMEISNFKAFPVTIIQENSDYLTKGSKIGDIDEARTLQQLKDIDGRLGMKIFQEFCLLLDLPHDVIYIARDQDALKKEQSWEGFIELPLLSNEWPVISVDTEYGMKRMLLDTGASFSVWCDPIVPDLTLVNIHQVKLGERNFGQQEFMAYSLPESFEIDGVLGIDFLKQHTVFIDLKNKRALISPPKNK